jgi:glycosyltransferase involved in cell wall biosynthesis
MTLSPSNLHLGITTAGPAVRAVMLYEHCSPHQVAALEAARTWFAERGDLLVPLECYSASREYGWSFADRPRPEGWQCLFPGRQQASTQEIVQSVRHSVRDQKIHVLAINGWYGRYAWPLLLRKKKLGCRVVMVSDSNRWDRPRRFYKEWAKRWLLRHVDAGFAAGAPQRDYLMELGIPADRIGLGNDVVDTALYTHLPGRGIPDGRPIIFGTAARLIWEKNLAQAISAFAALQRAHPHLQLRWRIAGRGPLEDSLRALITQEQAPVELLGFVGYSEIPNFYAGLDIYWQPSIYEHWGLVVNEAMASGLPVLVSRRCGCHRDLVGLENGWIHDSTTPADLLHGLETALAARFSWPEYGRASRHRIESWGLTRFAQGLHEACHSAVRSVTV